MAFNSYQIHAGSTDTEIEWVQRIIDTICGIDSRVTCNTTAAAQYADLTSAARATFDIDINGKYKLRLKRSATNNTQTSQYIFSIIVNESEYSISSAIRMWTTNTAGTGTVSNGYFKVSALVTDNDIIMWFGAAYGSEISDIFPKNYASGYISGASDAAYCFGVYNSNDIIAQALYKTDGLTGFSLVKPLNFTEAAGNIAIINNCFNPIASSGAFADFTKDLISCSTLTIGSSVIIDGEAYLAIGTNLLIKEAA